MLVLIGSLSSAVVLLSGSLLVWWLTARRAAKAAEQDRQQKAYADLLVASVGISLRVHTMLTMLKTRSGLAEGIAVTFGQRKQLDALELHDWLNTDFGALMDAWSRAWAYGSADGVNLSNKLLDSCRRVMEMLSLADAIGAWQKTRQAVIGVETDRLAGQWNERIIAVAVARRDLAEYMRAQTGRPAAKLFSVTDARIPGERQQPEHSRGTN